MVCETVSVCLTPCRAKPVASKEAAIRGRIVADVVFGEQKHKLSYIKNVAIIIDVIVISSMWVQWFPLGLGSEEFRSHGSGIDTVHGEVGSAWLTQGVTDDSGAEGRSVYDIL